MSLKIDNLSGPALAVLSRLAGEVAAANGKRQDLNQPMTDEELKVCVDKADEIMGLKPTRAVGAPK